MEKTLKCEICKNYSPKYSSFSCHHACCGNCLYKNLLFNYQNLISVTSLDAETEFKCIVCEEGKAKLTKRKIIDMLKPSEESKDETMMTCREGHNKLVEFYCFDCKWQMCSTCYEMHKNLSSLSTHKIFNQSGSPALNTCMVHGNKSLKFQCLTCNMPICGVCKTLSHKKHDLKYIQEFYQSKRDELYLIKKPFETLEQLTYSLASEEEKIRNEIKNRSGIIVDEIQCLIQKLQLIKKEFISKISQTEEITVNNEIVSIIFEKLYDDIDNISPEDYVNVHLLSKIPRSFYSLKLKHNFDHNFTDYFTNIESGILDLKNCVDKIIPFSYEGSYEPIETLEGHNGSVISMMSLKNSPIMKDGPDDNFSKEVIISGSCDNRIKIWKRIDDCFECIDTFMEHKDYVWCLINLEDGKFASGSDDKCIKIWGYVPPTKVEDPSTLTSNYKCLATVYGHGDSVYSLIYLGDGKIASGSEDKTVKIWDVKNILNGYSNNYKCLATLTGHTDTVYSLLYINNHKFISGSLDSSMKIWESSEIKSVKENVNFRCTTTLTGHTNTVFCMLVLPDGKIVSGSGDKKIKIWEQIEPDVYKCVITLNGHTKSVWSLLLLNSARFASGSGDNTIKIWNVLENFNCVATLCKHSNTVWSLLKLKDERFASGSADTFIKIWE
jgi:WD40 repeat protein